MFSHSLKNLNPQQLAFLAEFGLEASKKSVECARLLASLRDLEKDSEMADLVTPMLQQIKSNLAKTGKPEDYVIATCLVAAKLATTSERQQNILNKIVEQHLAAQTVHAAANHVGCASHYDAFLSIARRKAEQFADLNFDAERTPGQPEMNYKVGLIQAVLTEYLTAYEKSGWFSKLWNLFGYVTIKSLQKRIGDLQRAAQNVEDRQVPGFLRDILQALASISSFFVPNAAFLAIRRAVSKGFFTEQQQTMYQQEVGSYVAERIDHLSKTSFNNDLVPVIAEVKGADLATTQKDFPRLNLTFQGISYKNCSYEAFCKTLREKGYNPQVFDLILNNQFFATQERAHLTDPLMAQGVVLAQLADGQQQRVLDVTVDPKGVFRITNHGNYSFMKMDWANGGKTERLYPETPVHVELVEVLSLDSKSTHASPINHSVVLIDHTQGGISQMLTQRDVPMLAC